MELGFAFVHVHTGVKSFSGSFRLWFKKFTLAAIRYPCALTRPRKSRRRQFCFCHFHCSPQTAPEIKLLPPGSAWDSTMCLWCLFQCRGPGLGFHCCLSTYFTCHLPQSLYPEAISILLKCLLICPLRILDRLTPTPLNKPWCFPCFVSWETADKSGGLKPIQSFKGSY